MSATVAGTRLARGALPLLVTALLAGCATRGLQTAPAETPELRRQRLLELDTWEARGRVAVKSATDGAQGNLQWMQQGEAARIRVSGPFGAGAYAIEWSPEHLVVTSARGRAVVEYAGADAAERFLADQLGWYLPIAGVRYWLLGIESPSSPAAATFDAEGRLAALEQDGWTIDYQEYRLDGGAWMPRRLSLASGDARIRLVIDEWRP